MLLSEFIGSTTKPARIKTAKARVSSPKSALLAIAASLEDVSPREAGKLRTIIAKLEDWQNG